MHYGARSHLLAFLLDLLTLLRRSDHAKDLEIVALRQQLHLLQRAQPVVRPSRCEKLVLAVLVATLKRAATRVRRPWQSSLVLCTPATVLRWQREVGQCKWTFADRPRRGRPGTPPVTDARIVRLAQENPRWGYKRIHGELHTLGLTIGASTVRAILARQHIRPAPERARRGSTGRQFLTRHAHEMLACDFVTSETACSPARRRGSKRCTCSSSSTWAAEGCIWRAAPPIRPAPG